MGARILVVDDNALNLELVTDVLERAGYAVERAVSAEMALTMAQRSPPDLVMMDIGLPGMDGYSALAALRTDARTRTVPVVALTAYAMAGDEIRALEAGFAAYITKPIHTRQLPEVVNRVLWRGREE